MNSIRLGPRPEEFIWASGIEDTFVPQTRRGHRALDEYELVGHYQHWREDLILAKQLGVKALRWGVPWYRVEPQQGEFDWRWTDELLPYLVEELGITPIVDLMHYGCPFWLRREFASAEYPQAVAKYAGAFAERYKHLTHWYTPLNEPLVNALRCGKRGLWPPYLRGDSGYITIMLQLVKGIRNTVAAIKSADPDAILVHVEASGLTRAARADLEVLAAEDQLRGFLCYDLLTGRLTSEHPLFTWLLRNGASPNDLSSFARTPIELDVLGLNFYPQWSTQQISVDSRGRLMYRATEKNGAGFGALIDDFYRRYEVPVIVTETSAKGSDHVRARWLEASVAAVKCLREQGVPVLGYTWFPMFTMIDWRYRYGREPLERYRLELGMYTLAPDAGSRWRPTPLVEQYRSYINAPQQAIGDVSLSNAAGYVQ
jgi:beta-glucosidase/6-phospho-beta-glucosidase/beta-galactosidase